jgi:hypothetical protein
MRGRHPLQKGDVVCSWVAYERHDDGLTHWIACDRDRLVGEDPHPGAGQDPVLLFADVPSLPLCSACLTASEILEDA